MEGQFHVVDGIEDDLLRDARNAVGVISKEFIGLFDTASVIKLQRANRVMSFITFARQDTVLPNPQRNNDAEKNNPSTK